MQVNVFVRVYLWKAYRSTHVWSRTAAAWTCWSGHCTQHSPSCHPPRSYHQWTTSPPAQRQICNTPRSVDGSPGHSVNVSVYSQENHQTTPKLRHIQGLSCLNPPRTNEPLFWKKRSTVQTQPQINGSSNLLGLGYSAMIFLPSPLGRLSSLCEEKQFPLFYILDLAVDLISSFPSYLDCAVCCHRARQFS